MAIESISGAGAATSSIAESRETIADNFDTFLGILTTQLKNQNPLEPLDTNQFTQQLVQFTGVEQQLKTNEFLEAMMLAQSGNGSNADQVTQAVNMIGKSVTAGTSRAELIDGEASWTYTIASDAPNTQITVRDSSGNVVHSEEISLAAGQGTYVWDGKDASGLEYDAGEYSIAIDARDEDGNSVSGLTQTKGVVEMVDLTGAEPVLIVNGSRIALEAVLSVAPADPIEDNA